MRAPQTGATEKHTNGLIKNVLPEDAVDFSTSLIFAIALYLKGEWSNKFNASWTEEFDFHLLNGNKVRVPFMTNSKYQFVQEYSDFKVLGLPYSKGQDTRKFTMYFFLPHAKNGLRSLVKKVGSTSNFLDHHIPRQKVKVRKFFIPKFKMSSWFKASDMLKELGLVLPFKDVNDFTKMVDLPNSETLYISEIYHKSCVEVNEEGTEAAVVSVVGMVCASAPSFQVHFVDFVADHPFLFVIREDVTGAVLFMGQLIDPRS